LCGRNQRIDQAFAGGKRFQLRDGACLRDLEFAAGQAPQFSRCAPQPSSWPKS